MASTPNLHITTPINRHTHTCILLHGRDSTASEFASEFFESQASDGQYLQQLFPSMKWVFPGSKIRHSARFDTELSQWFDIWSTENPQERREIQLPGLRDSVSEILQIIATETEIVQSPKRIILGGISQGCATAIHALLTSGQRLGSFVGFCSWMPFREEMESDPTTTLRMINESFDEPAMKTPIFIAHSQDDDVVPIHNGLDMTSTLRRLGMDVTWKQYQDGGHWLNEPRGIDDLVEFLQHAITDVTRGTCFTTDLPTKGHKPRAEALSTGYYMTCGS